MKYPEESQAAFLVCTFSMLAKIVAADGAVSPREMSAITGYMDNELQYDKKAKALAMKVFDDALDSPLELRDYAQKFKDAFPDRVQLLDRIVQILLEVSFADGMLDPAEDSEVRTAALLLGMSDPGYQRLKKKFITTRLGSLRMPESEGSDR